MVSATVRKPLNKGHIRRIKVMHDDRTNQAVWGWGVFVARNTIVPWTKFESSLDAWEEAKRFYRRQYGKG